MKYQVKCVNAGPALNSRQCVSSPIDSHGVTVADVFAGGLDDGLAGLVEGPVDAVVGSGVGLLDQTLELRV